MYWDGQERPVFEDPSRVITARNVKLKKVLEGYKDSHFVRPVQYTAARWMDFFDGSLTKLLATADEHFEEVSNASSGLIKVVPHTWGFLASPSERGGLQGGLRMPSGVILAVELEVIPVTPDEFTDVQIDQLYDVYDDYRMGRLSPRAPKIPDMGLSQCVTSGAQKVHVDVEPIFH